MDLILNGEAKRLDTTDCANLAELVSMAENIDPDGEESVVVSVEVDGEPLSPDDLGGLERHPLDGVGRVAIQRRPTRVVALSVLEQGADYCGRIAGAIDGCVGEFRSARRFEARQTFVESVRELVVVPVNEEVRTVPALANHAILGCSGSQCDVRYAHQAATELRLELRVQPVEE